ncbi:hypothetical protein FKB36_03390 [Methanoculleus sp. Afa-1]|uniref:Uncharacterized protein n=1 Tax=Methanoculleus formosensis TaxID=2590886 RepID=A0A9E4ZLK0_9EURY|nr:hypothetical protein [Methanoculleus sp. Afa-1]MCT8336565.1 hypothetical protein [Methanoculleus sp. Afa-1]
MERSSGPVDLEAGKKYTITIQLSPENSDVTTDPAFDIASLAVDTHISDLAAMGTRIWKIQERPPSPRGTPSPSKD